MPASKWHALGFVTIDTASLLLVDPMHVEELDCPPTPVASEEQIDSPGGGYSAVVVPTGMGDGRYLVEGRYYDCRLAEIRIRFLDEDGNWLGADSEDERETGDVDE